MTLRTNAILTVFVLTSALATAQGVALNVDVQLQVEEGQIVTGAGVVNEAGPNSTTQAITIGQRVYAGALQSNFRTSNPGFNSTPSGNPLLPAGIEGFASGTSFFFDFLPIHVDSVVSTVFYWDGLDIDGGGVSETDVSFITTPSNVTWEFRDGNSQTFVTNGGDQLVPGGFIATTNSDGLHDHRFLSVNDGDPFVATTADEGVYLASLQLRTDEPGIDSSDPIFFVHRTPTIPDATLTVAAEWIDANYDALIGLEDNLPGDINGDGSVDLLDLDILGANFGLQPAMLAQGDLNADAVVDLLDLDVLGANFGVTAAAAIPEPSAAGLLIAVAIVTAFRHRRAA